MKIAKVLHVIGRSGSYNKDLAAMRAGAKSDGFIYAGEPVTPGFTRIVQPGAAVSIMLLLEDGQVAFGDCTDVIFSGAAGRDRLFRPEEHQEFLAAKLPSLLQGRDVGRFRPLAEEIDRLAVRGDRLHAALRYGITQALLHATALAQRVPMAQVIAGEYGCPVASAKLPILVSSPTGDRNQLDMRILKRVDLLPHSSFTHVERHVGLKGEKLIAYGRDVVRRIAEIGEPGYRPTIHLDVYGTLGELFRNNIDAIAGYLGELKQAVGPHELMVEAPVIMPSRAEQIAVYQALCASIRRLGHGTQIIVDEWCNTLEDVKAFADAGAGDLLQVKTPDLGGINNTIEAVLYARGKGIGVSLGGSLNETDQSARITAHIGLACRPTYLFAKPGAGGDAGLMILDNEMIRTLALLRDMRKVRDSV
jgi:methylaspartate ammonia-lyase